MKIKPESEISSHITLTSVISGLFHTRYLYKVVSTRGRVTHSIKLAVGGLPTPPANILAAALSSLLSRVHCRKVAVKTKKIEKFGW